MKLSLLAGGEGKQVRSLFSPKILFYMKVNLAVLVIMTFSLQLMATSTNGQDISEIEVSIFLKNGTLSQLFDRIQNKTGLSFVFTPDQAGQVSEINLSGEKMTVKALLDLIFKGTNLTYKQQRNAVSISFKTDKEDKQAILLPADTESVLNQTKDLRIIGQVTDSENSEPMPGVSVLVRGTSNGTTTDVEGRYTLEVQNENDVLVFTSIGYKISEIQINGRTTIDVVMEEEISHLKEVVVRAGYYDVKQKENPGNISKVTSKEISTQPIQNPIAALQGRVTGLEVTQRTGMPGGNFKIRIRGTNSIANGNDPLFIVDGVPYSNTPMIFTETSAQILGNGTSPLNNINPSNIESIEVLKDADATAIYGSRGANGVILITTKKGQSEKTNVNVNFYSGAATVPKKYDLLNTKQYIAMRKEAFANDGTNPTVGNARDLMVWDTTRYTDWQDKLIGGTANTTDAQISISGGERSTQFSFGTGYHRETAVMPGESKDQRISAHLNVTNTAPNKKLRTAATVNYSMNNSDLPNTDLTAKAIYLPPNAPALYDENGELNWNGWDPFNPTYENPIAFIYRRYESKTRNLIASAGLGYFVLPNLELKMTAGMVDTNVKAYNLVPQSSNAPSTLSVLPNTTYYSFNTIQIWNVEPQANWRPKLGKGQFDILVGSQFLDQVSEGESHRAEGFTSESLMKNIFSAANRFPQQNNYAQYRYHAVFGRLNYNYDGKYIINITGRRDGSSRFGPGKQFANFGAIGAAWIFSNEGFIKNALSFLSFGKLRGSYGVSGNDQLRDYEYLDAYTTDLVVYQGVIGLTPVSLSNPDFAWERVSKIEGGIELGFLEDRISTSISYYRNRSSNQLVGNPLPPTAGFTTIQANFPATVQNYGVEITLSSVNVRKKDITWTTSLNITIPKNKLIDFPDMELFPSYANRYIVGKPLDIQKSYNYLGIDPTTGVYQFEDVNGDGSYNQSDRQIASFIGQKFRGGLHNSVTFKGFELDVLFQFVKQHGRSFTAGTAGSPGTIFNQPTYFLDRWQTEGDNSEFQRYGRSSQTTTPYSRFQNSQESVEDASFIRLKNISISYSIPQAWSNKLRMTKARIFIQGQNLLTITNYSGFDVENPGSIGMPPLRILTGGVSLTF